MYKRQEYVNDDFSAFFQGSVSQTMYQRWDHYQYADQSLIDGTSSQSTGEALPEGITDGVESESADNFGYNAKAGVGFGVGENGKAYVNAGYYSRAPYFDNIYLNYTNQINPNTSNETIIGLRLVMFMKFQTSQQEWIYTEHLGLIELLHHSMLTMMSNILMCQRVFHNYIKV